MKPAGTNVHEVALPAQTQGVKYGQESSSSSNSNSMGNMYGVKTRGETEEHRVAHNRSAFSCEWPFARSGPADPRCSAQCSPLLLLTCAVVAKAARQRVIRWSRRIIARRYSSARGHCPSCSGTSCAGDGGTRTGAARIIERSTKRWSISKHKENRQQRSRHYRSQWSSLWHGRMPFFIKRQGNN